MIIEGDCTTAEVKLPEDEIEDSLREEMQEMVNHEAFQNPVKFMPDCHGGLGPQAIVGFSMELGGRIVPNTVGGDIGCGMTAVKLDGIGLSQPKTEGNFERLNDEVRSRVPMGTGRVNNFEVGFEGLYPWSRANSTLLDFFDFRDRQYDETDFKAHSFDMDYAEELFQRVGISKEYAKNSLGSLGGGNHFIEVAESEQDGSAWVVVHSGSRNLGQKVAGYHQEKATEQREGEVEWSEMNAEQRQYAMSDGSPNWEKIKRAFDGEKIQELGEQIKSFSADSNRNTDLDYLTGAGMFGYLKDMVFAQEYASENRRLMAREVASTLDAEITEVINSSHNYVDFEDGVIRKGSTRAGRGERFVIPMNMEDGTLLCRGKGNSEWNNSAPHGAGRLGSRGWAKSKFDADETRKRMYDNGTYSAHVPGDEVPEAYKDTQLIERQIEPTAEIVDRLKPIMNFKA